MRELNLDSNPAPGMLFHVAGPMDGGWRVVDVWESQEAFDRFFNQRLGQAVRNAGIPPFQPQAFPLHNIVVGTPTGQRRR